MTASPPDVSPPDVSPDVTIVIAAWQAEASIARAWRSALAQDGVAVEVIVVDDASTDGTAAAVKACGDARLRLLRQNRNLGPAAARNRGFEAATGRWIAVLDADDAMEPGRLAHLVHAGETNAADIVIDDLISVTEQDVARGPVFGEALTKLNGQLALAPFMLSARVFARAPNLGYAKPVFRKSFLTSQSLGYDPALRIGEDYALLADCLAAGASVRVVDRPLYRYTQRKGSISHRLGLEEIVAMREADRDFAQRWQLGGAAKAALRRRVAAFDDAAAFTRAVTAIKRRHWKRFAAILLRRPRAALLFRYPLGARLARDRGGAS